MASTSIPATRTDVLGRFVGTYELVSFEIRRPDGKVAHPLGTDAVGRISYDDAGRMAVQVMRRDRPSFASGDMLDATPDELHQAWAGFIAYAGTFHVDAAAGSVVHRIEISSFPNWVGEDHTRIFAFDGDRLELTTPPVAYGGSDTVAALVWRRV